MAGLRSRAPVAARAGVDRFARLGLRADARQGEQVVDELLHPVGPVHGVSDELVRVGIELALVTFGEELRVAADHAQRFLQIVRGHVGKPFQFRVGARQVERELAQRLLRLFRSVRSRIGDDGKMLAADLQRTAAEVDGKQVAALAHAVELRRRGLKILEGAVGAAAAAAACTASSWPTSRCKSSEFSVRAGKFLRAIAEKRSACGLTVWMTPCPSAMNMASGALSSTPRNRSSLLRRRQVRPLPFGEIVPDEKVKSPADHRQRQDQQQAELVSVRVALCVDCVVRVSSRRSRDFSWPPR